jgi:hypothetical protein
MRAEGEEVPKRLPGTEGWELGESWAAGTEKASIYPLINPFSIVKEVHLSKWVNC